MRRWFAAPLATMILVAAPSLLASAVSESDSGGASGPEFFLQTDFDWPVAGPYLDPPGYAEFGCEGDCATDSFQAEGVTCPTGPKCARVNHIDTKIDGYEEDFWPYNDCNGPPFHHMGIIDVVDPGGQAFVGLATMVTTATVAEMLNDEADIEIFAGTPKSGAKVVQVRLRVLRTGTFKVGIAVFHPARTPRNSARSRSLQASGSTRCSACATASPPSRSCGSTTWPPVS